MCRSCLESYELSSAVSTISGLETLHRLAGLLQELGQLEEAEKMSRRALDGFEHYAGMSLENVWALDSRYQLAGILENQGKLDEADQMRQNMAVELER